MGDETYRECEASPETLGHILSCCEEYKWGLCKDRHDRVLYQLTKLTMAKLGMKLPNSLRAPGGMIRGGTIKSNKITILVDQCIPTIRLIEERKPDLVICIDDKERIIIFEVAICWEPLLKERETQKHQKYQELAADMANPWNYLSGNRCLAD